MKKQAVVKLFILVAYSALIFILVINHEYWFDEGQAWNIARDNDVAEIFAMMTASVLPRLHRSLTAFIAGKLMTPA